MVKVEDVSEIVEEHILKGRIVTASFMRKLRRDELVKSLDETDFYKSSIESPCVTAAS